MFADDDVDEEKNDIKKKKTDENFRERDDIMCVLSFFLPVSSVFCFCRCLFSVSFLTSDGLSNEENSSFGYDVVVTKKHSSSVCAEAGTFSQLQDCSLCATKFSWLFSLERSRCLCSI